MDFDVTRADVLLSCGPSRQPSRKADYLGHFGAASRDPLCSSQAGEASAIPTWLSNGLLGTTTSDVPSTGALPPVSELRPGIRSGSGLQLWALSAQTAYQQTSSPKDDMRGFARQEAMPYQVDGATLRAPCAHETYPTENMFAYSEISRSDLATVEALSSLRTSVEQIDATEGVLNVGGITTSYHNVPDHPYSNIPLLSISNAQLTSEEQTTLNRIVDDSLFSVAPKPSLPCTIQPSTVVHEKGEKNSGTLETAAHHSSLVALTRPGVGLPSIEAACKSEPPLREDRNPPACPNVAPVQCSAGQDARQAERRAASLVEEVRCFRCTVCSSLHETKAEAVEHVAQLHSPGAEGRPSSHAVIGRAEKRFLCGKCRRGFVTLDECCRHLKQAHKAKSKKIRLEWIYTNQPDQMRAATPAEEVLAEVPAVLQGSGAPEYGLQKEAVRSTSKKDSGRKFVDAPMSSSQKAWRRKVNREQESFICERKGCNVRFRELENLEYHVRCHRADAADFACPECSLVCLRWRTMTVHLWRQHLCDMELHCCDQCNFRTYSLSKLENLHKRIHGDERPFLCDVCGKGFKTSKQLRNHKAIHVQAKRCAAGGSMRGESCAECGRCFCKRRLLQLHRNSVHRKLRPFLCSYCGHRASDQSSLKMHLRQHTGEKPFACHLCDYRTGDHNSLRRHKMRHTGAKPYKCPHCPYACIQSSTFKGHLHRKHPGESGTVLFACEQCPFRTVRKDNYKAHLAGHSEQAAATRDGSEHGLLEHASRLSLGQIVELAQSAGAS
ncbi:unnamed protein product [Ixodes persulcatus]